MSMPCKFDVEMTASCSDGGPNLLDTAYYMLMDNLPKEGFLPRGHMCEFVHLIFTTLAIPTSCKAHLEIQYGARSLV
jgi:hypothetical protein